jgi:hypothetical protein
MTGVGPFTQVAHAQSALAAAQVDAGKLPPEGRLTLRPSPGLEELAAKIARVLSLRTGAVVVVGDTPPAGMVEAVPAGHVALETAGSHVRLVLGSAFGSSVEAQVQLTGGTGDADARSLALAIEALRDQAIEARERLADAAARDLLETSAAVPAGSGGAAADPESAPPSATPGEALRDDIELEPLQSQAEGRYLKPVRPMFYLRAYSGASTASTAPRLGIGGGGGLCVLGHCLLLTADYPIPLSTQVNSRDIRYSYLTFTSGFYSHPVSFGRFTPGASIGFLTRLGHFERDMGLSAEGGLETDLGVRGTLEAAYEVVRAVDLVAELGLDYALDRWRLSHGGSVAYRGQRATPWLQAVVRLRPY